MKPRYNCIIIGAGLTGLSAAYFLRKTGQKNFIVFEMEKRPGGLCRTDRKGNCLFDRCGHLLHFKSEKMRRLTYSLLRGNIASFKRNSKIFSHGRLTDYPFQNNLHGLPDAVVIECIEEYINARYKKHVRSDDGSFGSWVENNLGKGIARHFMLPYNEKLLVYDPHLLTTEWMGHYVPQTDLHELLSGAIQGRTTVSGYNSRFFYPATGGIEALVAAFTKKTSSDIMPSKEITRVDYRRKTVIVGDGEEFGYDTLITTMPLNRLIERMPGVPANIRKLNNTLQFSGVYNINLVIKGTLPEKPSWIYFPEKNYPFYRIGFYTSFAPKNSPPGTTSLYVEIAYRDTHPDGSTLLRNTIRCLRGLGYIKSSADILKRCTFDIPCAYVTYDKHWSQARNGILSWLRQQDINSIGRYGAWEYSDMETNMQSACDTVENICK